MSKYFILFFTFLLMFGKISVNGQQIWSLKKCIEYAKENNIQLKQQILNSRTSKNQYAQSMANVLPSANASAGQSYLFGRTVNPYTNQFIENNSVSTNFSVSGNMDVFNGFQNYNSIMQNRYNMLAELQGVEKLKNDITLNVMTAFLQIVYNEGLYEISKNQFEITGGQVTRTRQLVEAGSLARGNLLEMEAQLAIEEMNLLGALNNVNSAKLSLIQMLNLDSIQNFEIAKPDLEKLDLNDTLPSIETIYNEALALPQIKESVYRMQSARRMLAISRGRLSPTVSLSASWSTGYSDARKKKDTTVTIGPPIEIGYVENTLEKVYSPTFINKELEYNFEDQLKDNQSKSIGANLNVPIFNGLMNYTGMRTSRFTYEIAKLQVDAVKKTLYKDIQMAHNDVSAAKAKYNAALKANTANQESYNYTKQKFDVGLLNSLDFNTAKANMMRAQTNLLQAKLEYVFKLSILNFYRGKPVTI